MKNLFVLQANPVGVATNFLDEKVTLLKLQWDQENAERKADSKWWKFWTSTKEGLMASISFLINCLDVLIIHAKDLNLEGPDKKATVLLAAVIIYDYVVAQTLPIFLKPFSSSIKQIVIYIVLSYMIDFIVKKYNDGLWSKNEEIQTNP
jgi:hypothetical protein